MRTKPITSTALIAAAAGLGLLLTGCGNAPGSLTDDPLAVKLVEAEAKVQAWGGAELDLVFSGSGQLGGRSLPCISMSSKLEPEQFEMQIVTDSTGTGRDCVAEPDATGTKQIWYTDGVMYLADESDPYGSSTTEDAESCEVRATSHAVTDELAGEFAKKQTQQAKMADLMKAATEISGDDRTINVTLDTETVAELGSATIPSGVDADDIETSMVVQLDSDGALERLDLTVGAEGTSLDIHTSYAKPSGEKVTPPTGSCVTEGEAYSSMSQLESALT